MKKEGTECKISKTKISRGASGLVMEEIYLEIIGDSLKECEEVFDRKWN